MSPLIILATLVIIFVIFGVMEKRKHNRSLSSIPIRIHINGTRGKSSVTRLVAAGLRAGGIPTIAKTTGSAARMIWEDGSETPVERFGPPSIREQISVVNKAAERGAKALVVECMALQPDYQFFTEHRFVRSTHGVITNVRADHLDVMGPTELHVAAALSNSIPRNSKCYTTEERNVKPLRWVARKLGTELCVVPVSDQDREDAGRFSYIEHPENIAIALSICEDIGIDRSTALSGMLESTPDIGALKIWEIHFFDNRLYFVNALAANDPESTLLAVERAKTAVSSEIRTIVLFNNRGDRLSRAKQFGDFLATDLNADHNVLIGDVTKAVEDEAIRAGLPAMKITNLGQARPPEIFEKVLDLVDETALVVAIGNLGGLGGSVAAYFQHRGKPLGSGISGPRSHN